MKKEPTQELKKITDRETLLFVFAYVLFVASKNEFIPREVLPFCGIPLLFNFWLLSKHYKLMQEELLVVHPKRKRMLKFRFYLNAIIDGLLVTLILWEVL